MPACALGLAACACAVEVDTCGRIFARQAVRYGVVNLGLILAVVKAGDFHAVDDKGRVGAVISAGEYVRVLKLRDIHQNGREIGVVCLDDVVRAVERVLCALYGLAVGIAGLVGAFLRFDRCLGIGCGRDLDLGHIAAAGLGAEHEITAAIHAHVEGAGLVALILGNLDAERVVVEAETVAVLLPLDLFAGVLFNHLHVVDFCHGLFTSFDS